MAEPSPSVERVVAALRRGGVETTVRAMPASTRTAQEAAEAVGCALGQIVKSLVFRRTASQEPLLVLVSGADRVDEAKLAAVAGEQVNRPDAAYVRERTGFAIGGVAPVGHTGRVETLVNRGLTAYDEVWAAAGSPYAVFQVAPAELVRVTAAAIVDVAAD